jgi:hypothetical protein
MDYQNIADEYKKHLEELKKTGLSDDAIKILAAHLAVGPQKAAHLSYPTENIIAEMKNQERAYIYLLRSSEISIVSLTHRKRDLELTLEARSPSGLKTHPFTKNMASILLTLLFAKFEDYDADINGGLTLEQIKNMWTSRLHEELLAAGMNVNNWVNDKNFDLDNNIRQINPRFKQIFKSDKVLGFYGPSSNKTFRLEYPIERICFYNQSVYDKLDQLFEGEISRFYSKHQLPPIINKPS